MNSSGDFADFARELARAARAETLSRFGRTHDVDNKANGGSFDPVTEADRAAEAVMRRLIEVRFPEHGIVGEEFGERRASGPYCWSLDPSMERGRMSAACPRGPR